MDIKTTQDAGFQPVIITVTLKSQIEVDAFVQAGKRITSGELNAALSQHETHSYGSILEDFFEYCAANLS